MIKLKCPECGSVLTLSVGFTGCDWDSEAGKGSNYNWEVALCCSNSNCALVFTIGHIKNLNDFSMSNAKCYDLQK